MNTASFTALIVECAGIRTRDYQLAYRLIDALRSSGIRPIQLAPEDPVPASMPIWFGTPSEVESQHDSRGIACTVDNLETAISYAILGPTMPVKHLVFGVDPGPRPGLAWMACGKLLGAIQLESVDEAPDHIGLIVHNISPKTYVVRVGDGSRTIARRLANVCLARGHIVEFVDERRTSRGSRHNHSASAARIARKIGTRVIQRLVVDPSDGELREIQRRSRTISEGRLTIPRSLAKAVAVGRMSMHDAIKAHSNRAAAN